jgi:hypothetical protein
VEAEFFLEAAAGCYRLVYEPIKEDLWAGDVKYDTLSSL